MDMNKTSSPNAKQITRALIDWLDLKHKDEDKTITTEISINPSQTVRVVDVLMTTNKRSTAFEIKSGLDTTARLLPQLNGYLEKFEHVYFVCWEDKYKIEELGLPDTVGVIKAFACKNEICFKVLRRPKISKTLQHAQNLLHVEK